MTNETTPCQEQITFDELYQNQSKNIFLYAYYSMKLSEEDAKDVMHEAFLLLLEIWLDFEPKIYPAAIVWLRTTIQNLVYDKNIKAQKMAGRFFDQLNIDQLESEFIGNSLCNFCGFFQRHRLPRQANPSKSVCPCKNTAVVSAVVRLDNSGKSPRLRARLPHTVHYTTTFPRIQPRFMRKRPFKSQFLLYSWSKPHETS